LHEPKIERPTTKMPAKMKLSYFNIRGLAETARLMLVDNGVEFEDHRVEREKEWPQLKSKLQFSQMPVLYDGDLQLVQTGAILRYLASTIGKGLYGTNPKEAAHIDMVYEGIVDLRMKYAMLIYRTEFTDADKSAFLTTLPEELEKFEKVLGKADFFGGKTISFADYAAYELFDCLVVLSSGCLDAFPALKALHGRVAARPGLKAYLASEGRKVPINGNGKQ